MTLETPADSTSQSRGTRESKITTHGWSGWNVLQGRQEIRPVEKQQYQETTQVIAKQYALMKNKVI